MFGWFKGSKVGGTAPLTDEEALAIEAGSWDFSRRSLLVDPAGIETMRDRFAMAALPAIITAMSAQQHMVRQGKTPVEAIAIDAYELADEMMKARDQ